MELILFAGSSLVKELPNLVGFFLPIVIQVLNLRVHREIERYMISVIVCILVAVGLHWQDMAFGNVTMVAASIGILFAESNTLYTLYFSRSGLRASLIQALGGTTNLIEPLEKVQPQNV